MGRSTFLALVVALAATTPAQAIVGGRPATQPYPYAAQLYVDGEFLCGGSLVRARWVLTAAHCVEDRNGDLVEADRFEVRLGRTRLSATDGEVIGADQVVQHEKWDSAGFDVALLRLGAASAQATVPLAGPAQRSLWEPGDVATVIGWGATSNGGRPSDELREVQVPVRSDEECSTVNGSLGTFDPEREFCAGETFGGRDSCQGDSGGPLLVRDAQGTYVQAGIVSSGLGCALPGAYGLYSRIGDDPLDAWLRAKLPAPPATPPGTGGGQATTVTIGKRLRKRGKRLRVRISASAPVSDVRVRVRRKGRLVARGRARSLEGTRTLRLKLRRKAPRGRYRVRVRAAGPSGAPISAARTARR